MIKKIIYFAGFFSSVFANSLDFYQAWSIVEANNHAIKAEQIAMQKTEKLKQANIMLYLPRIELTAGYAYLGSPVQLDLKSGLEALNSSLPYPLPPIPQITDRLTPLDLSNQHIMTASLKIIYPLYTGGATYAANRLGKLAFEDTQEALKLKKLSTFEQLANVYYGVLLNQEILKTLQDVEKGHKLHLENAQKLQKAGQIAKIETLSAQVAYDRAKNDTLKAQDSLEVSKLALQNLLSDFDQHYTLSSKLVISKHAKELILDPILKTTLDSYPALKSVDIKSKQAQELTKLERSKFLPTIALFGNYSYHDHNSILGKSLPSWFVGIGAKMTLLDNTGSYQKYQAGKVAQFEISERKKQAIKDISLLVEKTYKEAIQAKKLYFTLDSSIALAEENLKLQEKAFAQGMATSSQVIDARNLLSKAQIEQKSIAYKYILSVAKLMALSNSIYDFKLYQ
ncbi:TolC family protein [Helicobacter kayseriensis]|uniref:TolC family protein n=1 Tax=Helicobacter kayseriensis TaxID=2905877 RepID=UPI001E5B7061|nr:TolC family protein [Helicobacter kayseriensis]MCE3046989.1 TolC family protein [Helicobacter kayseriensis]MCE3048351.1 TolC family protein [Helicobacter kayseriensis]